MVIVKKVIMFKRFICFDYYLLLLCKELCKRNNDNIFKNKIMWNPIGSRQSNDIFRSPDSLLLLSLIAVVCYVLYFDMMMRYYGLRD